MKRLKTFSKKQLSVAVVILLGLISLGFFFDRAQHATIDFEAISDQKGAGATVILSERVSTYVYYYATTVNSRVPTTYPTTSPQASE
jgi:hypothetical protein